MPSLLFACCLILTVLTAQSTDSQAATKADLAGAWAGGFRYSGEFVAVELEFRKTSRGYSVQLRMPVQALDLAASCRFGDRTVTVDFPGGKSPQIVFTGTWTGDEMLGEVSGSEVVRKAAFSLVRVRSISERDRARAVGGYREDDNGVLRIVRRQQPGIDELRLSVPGHEVHGVLYPVSAREFVVGKGPIPLPIDARVRLRLDQSGGVVAIELTKDGRTHVARRDDTVDLDEHVLPPLPRIELAPGLGVERRDAVIEAGDAKLAATLYMPPGVARPCPAVVQLHGSAPTERRTQWGYYTSICLRSGLAVLAYDKRSCGGSTGVLLPFSVRNSPRLFNTLAGDAAAAHAWLRKQPGIDPERDGLVGGSQAGWIIPLVPEKTPGVRFIISGCGPTVSAGEENQHAIYLSKGLSIDQADRKLASFRGKRGFDPRPVLRRIDVPTLWLFGERDEVIPTRACLLELQKLRAEGHTHHVGHLFRDTDHSFRVSTGERALLEPVITHWLRTIGVND